MYCKVEKRIREIGRKISTAHTLIQTKRKEIMIERNDMYIDINTKKEIKTMTERQRV